MMKRIKRKDFEVGDTVRFYWQGLEFARLVKPSGDGWEAVDFYGDRWYVTEREITRTAPPCNLLRVAE